MPWTTVRIVLVSEAVACRGGGIVRTWVSRYEELGQAASDSCAVMLRVILYS